MKKKSWVRLSGIRISRDRGLSSSEFQRPLAAPMKCRSGFVSAPDQSRSLFTPVRDPAATLGSIRLLHHFGTTDRGSKDFIVMPRRHDCIFGRRSGAPQFYRVLGNDVVNHVVKFLTVLTPCAEVDHSAS